MVQPHSFSLKIGNGDMFKPTELEQIEIELDIIRKYLLNLEKTWGAVLEVGIGSEWGGEE